MSRRTPLPRLIRQRVAAVGAELGGRRRLLEAAAADDYPLRCVLGYASVSGGLLFRIPNPAPLVSIVSFHPAPCR